jgi:hypothetical protein
MSKINDVDRKVFLVPENLRVDIKPYWEGEENLPFLKKLAWDNFI